MIEDFFKGVLCLLAITLVVVAYIVVCVIVACIIITIFLYVYSYTLGLIGVDAYEFAAGILKS